MLNNNEIVPLLWKYIQKNLSETEQKQLELWRNESEENARLLVEIDDKRDLFNQIKEYSRLEEIFDKSMGKRLDGILSKNKSIPKGGRTIELRKWMMAAASILVVMAVVGYYFLNSEHKETSEGNPVVAKNEILPGQQKARLELADGTVIILEQAKTGELAKQGSAVISNDNGQLVYRASTETTERKPMYNALITERGETYVTTLSDGSRVWLNAQSSLRFPVTFRGNERNVELTGEAYFEVVSNDYKPFRVRVNGGNSIEVLGTRFGVSSYFDEEGINTSLLEGKVKVNTNQQSTILSPGQQAKIEEDGDIVVVKDADVEGAIAWKDGILHFSRVDITAVLRTLARWYDVKIEYAGNVSSGHYEGAIDRNVKLSEVLENFAQMTGMKFEINQRTVIVKP